jgi:hypothetical protein
MEQEARTIQHGLSNCRLFPRDFLPLLLMMILPAIFLFVAVQLTKVRGPQWLGRKFENSHPYLFNSLLLTKKRTPAMVAHPGIVAQLFGEAVLGDIR